jgi:hypothetical protein
LNALLADLIVSLHLAFVAFVVLGQILIVIGGAVGWGWVRNPWFRVAHLAATAFVALEAIIGLACPLTVWEFALRGEEGQPATLIGRIADRVLFYDFPEWVFTAAYIAFALLVAATLWLVPPRWRGGRRAQTS